MSHTKNRPTMTTSPMRKDLFTNPLYTPKQVTHPRDSLFTIHYPSLANFHKFIKQNLIYSPESDEKHSIRYYSAKYWYEPNESKRHRSSDYCLPAYYELFRSLVDFVDIAPQYYWRIDKG